MVKLLFVLALGAGLLFGTFTKPKAHPTLGPGYPTPPPCPTGTICNQ